MKTQFFLRTKRIFLLACFLLAITSSCTFNTAEPKPTATAESYVWTNGPGVDIWVLAIDPVTPTVLYAGTKGAGVFKTIDGGNTWNAINNGLSDKYIRDLIVDPATPTTLYIRTNDGVLKSTDGGGGWFLANTGLKSIDVTALAIDPVTPTTLYAGTENKGVFKSTDGAKNWFSVQNDLGDSAIIFLAVDPSIPATLYAGTSGNIFKSTDGGKSWYALNPKIYFIDQLIIAQTLPSTVYVITSSVEGSRSSIYRSTDGGKTWDDIGFTDRSFEIDVVDDLAVDPQTPNTLYIEYGWAGMFKSTDGGETWNKISLNPECLGVLVIDPVTPNVLYSGTGKFGVFKSVDGGETWELTTPPSYLHLYSNYFTVKYLGSHLSYATYQITNNLGTDVWTISQRDPDNGCSIKSTSYAIGETKAVSQLPATKTITLDCKENITSIDFYLDWAKSKAISVPLQH